MASKAKGIGKFFLRHVEKFPNKRDVSTGEPSNIGSQPVIMSVYIDFNAQEDDASTFTLEAYNRNGGPGHGGGHLVVLEDFTVVNVPGVGPLGEGDMEEDQRELALRGDLNYFVVKNSWGTNRPNRGLTDGYTGFKIGYLNAQLPRPPKDDADDDDPLHYSTVRTMALRG